MTNPFERMNTTIHSSATRELFGAQTITFTPAGGSGISCEAFVFNRSVDEEEGERGDQRRYLAAFHVNLSDLTGAGRDPREKDSVTFESRTWSIYRVEMVGDSYATLHATTTTRTSDLASREDRLAR